MENKTPYARPDNDSLEILDSMDDLFSPLNDDSIATPDDSPLKQLKSIVLAIEWEISDDSISQFLAEVERLTALFDKESGPGLFLIILENIGKYIKDQKDRSHPDVIRLFHSAYQRFEQVVESGDDSQGENRRHIVTIVNAFKELRSAVESRQHDVSVINADEALFDDEGSGDTGLKAGDEHELDFEESELILENEFDSDSVCDALEGAFTHTFRGPVAEDEDSAAETGPPKNEDDFLRTLDAIDQTIEEPEVGFNEDGDDEEDKDEQEVEALSQPQSIPPAPEAPEPGDRTVPDPVREQQPAPALAGEQVTLEQPDVRYRLCPYCAEEVKTQALVCRHCSRNIGSPARQLNGSSAAIRIKTGTATYNGTVYIPQHCATLADFINDSHLQFIQLSDAFEESGQSEIPLGIIAINTNVIESISLLEHTNTRIPLPFQNQNT